MTASQKITPAMVRRIELWPLDRLVPFARNPRTHSDAQVAQIAASIAEFGFNPTSAKLKARSRRINHLHRHSVTIRAASHRLDNGLRNP